MIEPVVTGAPPATTEALRVTGVCQATDDEESVSVVAVDAAAAHAAWGGVVAIASKADKSSLVFRPRRKRIQAEKYRRFHIQGSSVRTYKNL